jgi:chemotaxis protein histidine kinase CheA
MRKHPFSDDFSDEAAVEAVLRGETPKARPDLAPLAGAVADMRAASSGTPPQPNAALAALLDHGLVGQGLSAEKGDLPVTAASNASRPATQAFRLPKWRKRMIVEWIAGMGLAAKLGVGATVAAASVAGAGAGGVLPGPVQGAFESVVSTATPWETEAEKKAAEIAAEAEKDAAEAAEEAAAEAADIAKDAEEKAAEDAAADDSTNSDDATNPDDAAEDARDAEEEAAEDARDAEEQAADDARDAEEQAREDAEKAAERAREDQRDAEESAQEKQRASDDKAADDNPKDNGGSDD